MPPPAPAGGVAASKRPVDSPFYQQRLKAWQPILTPTWVVITFLLIGIPFVGIGFWLVQVSANVVEVRALYDGAGVSAANQCLPGASCTLLITAPQEMKKPVYVYYELTNFYQNHRRYVKSKSDKQLSGEVFTDPANAQLKDCDPLIKGNSSAVLQPCGLIAQSFFNDTFALDGSSGLVMSETGISWESDRKRFKGVPASERVQYGDKIKWISEVFPGIEDITNEHFIVWMRPAALPNFRKLYGIIESNIPANTTLKFNVTAHYPVQSFGGSKTLTLSTISVIGGKNDFLGWAYVAVGAACIALALLFGAQAFFGGRRMGDTAFLTWASK